MAKSKRLRIELESNDLGQLLDGLRAREEAWRHTLEYLETGECPMDVVIEECSDSREAAEIVSHYGSIIEQIERQVREQGGW